MKVICISGKAQHGKDTTAKYIRNYLAAQGYKVLITHYADLLKYICKTFFDWDEQKDEMGRGLLQYVGTDVIRDKKPNYWVDFVSSILNMFQNEWDYVLIPDCRFPNEVEKLIYDGFDVFKLRIVRPEFQSPLTKEQQNHPSEIAMDNYAYDYNLINDGTLNNLNEKSKRIAKDMENNILGRSKAEEINYRL